MDILPAVDLQDGLCVRLDRGDFAAATIYDNNPMRQAQNFAAAGAEWLHVIDLDGARAGKTQQLPLIVKIAQQVKLKLQVGGGIRDAVVIDQLLNAGVKRVVIGSLAVENPMLVKNWLHQFGPECLTLAFDVRLNEQKEPEVVMHGWQDRSHYLLWDVLKIYAESGLKTILCTDTGRDGMLEGTNHALYATLRERWPQLDVLASGGVKDQADIEALAKIGVSGVIVGKAIYEGRIDLKEAIQALKRNAG